MVEKSYTAYKTIGEVSKELNVPTHVLRFWETKFKKIKPIKRKNGHRYYTLENISALSHIKNLLQEQGLTIKGVQKKFSSKTENQNSDAEYSREYLINKELIEMQTTLKEINRELKLLKKK